MPSYTGRSTRNQTNKTPYVSNFPEIAGKCSFLLYKYACVIFHPNIQWLRSYWYPKLSNSGENCPTLQCKKIDIF